MTRMYRRIERCMDESNKRFKELRNDWKHCSIGILAERVTKAKEELDRLAFWIEFFNTTVHECPRWLVQDKDGDCGQCDGQGCTPKQYEELCSRKERNGSE